MGRRPAPEAAEPASVRGFRKEQAVALEIDWLSRLFSVDMGIDLGTCNTLVCVRGEGIVLNEPSVVAVRKGTNIVLNDGEAVGDEAKKMLGKTPGGIVAVRPLKDGVISDFAVTEAMLGYFIKKVNGKSTRIFGPRVVIAIPSGITSVEKQAVYESAERAGARRVYLVYEPMAAAIAIISLASIAECESLRVAGDDFDDAIINHMKRAHQLVIGEQTAERIKIDIGSAAPTGPEMKMDVRGRCMKSGLPRKVEVTSQEIREALAEPVNLIAEAVVRVLEKAKPELSADLVDNGIVLAGGGALLRGIDKVFNKATGLDVRIADDPLTCVARGTANYLENLDLFKDTLESDADSV
jgi:rod shape-determining protein MreB